MAVEPKSAQRRRAAMAVLSQYLDEDALFEALWLQDNRMRGDALSDVIAFIDAVEAQFMLDHATSKRLYGAFFSALKTPKDDLPADPWPEMQAWMTQSRSTPSHQEYSPAPVLEYQPEFEPEPEPTSLAEPVESISPAVQVAPVAPPLVESATSKEPQLIFGAMMRTVIQEIYEFHRRAADTIWTVALSELEKSELTEAVKMRFSLAWMRPLNDDWIVPGMSLELTELTRIMFVSLAHAFGRNGANQILGRGVASAEQLPEALKFPPKRLLSTL